ncbi:MAG TPA: hypothetical protein VD997_04165 [Phycisphaerales bacterium]|nr:hypothetical protein [Phycisphaerales bacterium]
MAGARGRWLRRGVAGLLLGAATTVLVSWSLAAWGKLEKSEFRRPPERAVTAARVRVPEAWTVRTWLESWGFGVDHQLISECVWMGSTLGMMSGMGPQRTMLRAGMGWPLLAMEYSDVDDTNRAAVGTGVKSWWELGVPLPAKYVGTGKFWRSDRRLPLRPLWPGFAVDTLVYACLWAGVLGVGGAWVRRRRVKRGVCAECCYPVVGGVCPECGRGGRAP